jgi:predicted TIM-barrel fold metal-dependent hydrolase
MPPEYHRLLVAEAEANPSLAKLSSMMVSAPAESSLRQLGTRIAEMDAARISAAIISLPPPGTYFKKREHAIRASSVSNEEIIAAASEHPGRFQVMITLPLPWVRDAVREVESLAAHPCVVGIGLLTRNRPWTLDDPRFASLYETAAALRLPIFLHPAVEPMTDAFSDFALMNSFAPVISSSTSALRFLLSGMLDRVPGLTVYLPHLGGVVPYLTQRILDQSGKGAAEHDIVHYMKNRVFLDNCSYHPPALRCAVQTAGADRIMTGSDYPFRGPMARCVSDIETSDLSQDEKDQILEQTVTQCFPRLKVVKGR